MDSLLVYLVPLAYIIAVVLAVVGLGALLWRARSDVRHRHLLQMTIAERDTSRCERDLAIWQARKAREAREVAEKEVRRLKINARHTKAARVAMSKVDNVLRTFTLMRDRFGELESLADNAAEHLSQLVKGD